MINVYFQSKTKLGYTYFSIRGNTYVNVVKKFSTESQMVGYLEEVKMENFGFDLDAFITIFKDRGHTSTHLESEALNRIERFHKWFHSQPWPKDRVIRNVVKTQRRVCHYY